MTRPLLRFDDVSKVYAGLAGAPVEALRNVAFEVQAGSALAVVGPNGAGKSTLLRVASGITVPTAGTIQRARRAASLIEVDASFDPELTGTENLALGLALQGVNARGRRRVLDDVIAFSGIEEALSTPVKRYSDGMRARLGVSIALHAGAELLLVDEVLSVGDHVFQRQVVERTRQMVADGAALVLATHDPFLATLATDRALWLNEGAMVELGPSAEVVGRYTVSAGGLRRPAPWIHTEITALRSEPSVIEPAQPVTMHAELRCLPGAKDIDVLVEMLPPVGDSAWWMRSPDQSPALRMVTVVGETARLRIEQPAAGVHTVRVDLSSLPMTPPGADLAIVVLDAGTDDVQSEALVPLVMAGEQKDTPMMVEVELSAVEIHLDASPPPDPSPSDVPSAPGEAGVADRLP